MYRSMAPETQWPDLPITFVVVSMAASTRPECQDKLPGRLNFFSLHDLQFCLMISGALLLKQMLKKQTGFVLLLKQNKSDLVFHHQN